MNPREHREPACPRCGRALPLNLVLSDPPGQRFNLWPTCQPCRLTYLVVQFSHQAIGWILGEAEAVSNFGAERAGLRYYDTDHPQWKSYLEYLNHDP